MESAVRTGEADAAGSGASSAGATRGEGGGEVVEVEVEAALRAKAGSRKGLVAHTDDSEVTLNCCLGLEFDGGEVEFRGLRSSEDEGKLEDTVPAIPGIAMIHLGQHLHRVKDVTRGQRHALIVWCRSEDYRGANCPCCVLHRRSRCVCDATWN